MNYKLIDQVVHNSNQSWNASEIRRYSNGSIALRANIRRNAYDDQSWATIEVWSATNGWIVISSHSVKDFPVASISYTVRELTEEYGLKIAETVSALFDIGERFFSI